MFADSVAKTIKANVLAVGSVTEEGYTCVEELSRASLVMAYLDDPDGEHSELLANKSIAMPSGFLVHSHNRCCWEIELWSQRLPLHACGRRSSQIAFS